MILSDRSASGAFKSAYIRVGEQHAEISFKCCSHENAHE